MMELTPQQVIYIWYLLTGHCSKMVDEQGLDLLTEVEAWLDRNRPGWREL